MRMTMLRSLTVGSLLIAAAVGSSVQSDPSHTSNNGHLPSSTANKATTSSTTSTSSTATTTSSVPPFPHFRFISWDKISSEARHHAHKVGYEEKSWNKPGTNKVEELSFDQIHTDHIPVYDELSALGFVSAPQWDCYINHYRALDWTQMDAQHQTNYLTLGWTQTMWDNDDDVPDTEDTYWNDLTPAQQAAAKNICYTQQMWDDVVLPLWGEDDGKGGSETQEAAEQENQASTTSTSEQEQQEEEVEEKQNVYDTIYDPEDQTAPGVPIGPRTAHNSRGIETPFFRYNAWQDLSADVKLLAQQAQYNGKSWDSFGNEKLDFETLGQRAPKIQQALVQLGFTEDQYDCHMIHYRTYDWDELKDAGVQQYYVTLGWTRDSWDNDGDAPPTDGMYWPDLSQEQQDAAYELCYFRETWDEVSMQFWPRTTANSPMDYAKDYAKTHPVKTGGVAAITFTILIGLCFCCAFACRAWFLRRSGKKSKGLEMYRFDDDDDNDNHNIQAHGSYRDDPVDAGKEDKPSLV